MHCQLLILDENSLLSATCPIRACTVQVGNFKAMLQSINLDDVSAGLKPAKDTYENVKTKCLSIMQRNLVPCVLMDKQFGSSISLIARK